MKSSSVSARDGRALVSPSSLGCSGGSARRKGAAGKGLARAGRYAASAVGIT
jgi:hypothetical protein